MHEPMPVSQDRLSHLRPGQIGKISQLHGNRDFNRQLLRMGLTPGTRVRFVRPAPLGDPLHFSAGNFELSLRRSTAAQIQIDSIDGEQA